MYIFAGELRVLGQDLVDGESVGYRAHHGGRHVRSTPGRTRRYNIPPEAARTITALLALRDQIIAPILASVRSPRRGRKPTHWTTIDRHYETLRIGMQDLLHDLGVTPAAAAAA